MYISWVDDLESDITQCLGVGGGGGGGMVPSVETVSRRDVCSICDSVHECKCDVST